MDVGEKLVELQSIITCPNAICNFCEHFKNKDACEKHKKEVIADNMIAHGVTVQKWISVTERLPEKNGWYIVTACDEGCSCDEGIWYDTVVIEAEHYKGEWSWNENGIEYDITCFVTHWQPMPQPPKGE